MEKQLNKHFCIQPFVHVTTRVAGQNNVCCNISRPESNIKNQSQSDFFNSDYVADMRKRMLNGEKIKDCSLCHYMEKNSEESHRQQFNEYYHIENNRELEYYPKIVNKLKLDKRTSPLYAELHVSNLCNLKCLTCNERDSSQFHAENKILGVSEEPKVDYTKFVVHTAKAVEDILKQGVLYLDIRGGETLLVPEIKKVLKDADPNITKNVNLKIQTNGTLLPDRDWLDIFNKFHKTKLNISIDAYGTDNEYVRFPSNWNKILYTLELLKKENIKFVINTVVSNLNIMVLHKLLQWVSDEGYLQYVYILNHPLHYQPTNLPQSILDMTANNLETVKNLEFKNKNVNTTVDRLIKMCKINNTIYWKRFLQEITMRDKHRKNSITNIIPQMKEYINA
tara:strand:+ start:11878 stop:13059 length:1182 start_codon:yes stop_codon:yes gene_type:complete